MGAYTAASFIERISASSMVTPVTAVTLTGIDCAGAGSFSAITVIAGRRVGTAFVEGWADATSTMTAHTTANILNVIFIKFGPSP